MFSRIRKKFWAYYLKVYDTLIEFPPYQKLIEDILKRLDLRPQEKVLEAGCGTGNIVIAMAKKKARVWGIDKERVGLQIAQQKLAENALNVVLLEGDISLPLPFKREFFDKVVCNNTLYILPYDKQYFALLEFYRVLKPGGVLILGNLKPNWSIWRLYKTGIKMSYQQQGIFITLFKMVKFVTSTLQIVFFNIFFIKKGKSYYFASKEELESFLKKAGFKIKEISSSYGGESFLFKAIKPNKTN